MVTATATSASTGTSTAAQMLAASAAANKANAQKIITSLGSGSGVDVTSLAQSLVAADKAPQENAINSRIAKNDSKVAGTSAVMFMLKELQTALTALKDKNSFNAATVTNSNTDAFNATTTSLAAPGSHSIEISALAQAQRTISTAYLNGSVGLNSGASFSLTLGGEAFPPVNGTAQTISVSAATPDGVVSAINAAGIGLNAKLVNTGATTPYKIMVTGSTGLANSFTLSSPTSDLSFGSTVAGTTASTSTAITAGDITINGTAIGAVTAGSGYSASSSTTSTVIDGDAPTTYTAISAGDIIINGVAIGAVAAGISVIQQGSNVAAAINLQSSKTGVTASASSTTGAVTLISTSITTAINTTLGSTALSSNSGLGSLIGTGSSTLIEGDAPTTYTAITAGDININGIDIGAVAAGTDAATQGANVAAAINLLSSSAYVTATADATTGAVSITSSVAGTSITTVIGSTALTTNSGLSSNIATSASTVVTKTGSVSTVTAVSAVVAQGNNVAAAINLMTQTTGVIATNDGGAVSLASSTGAITALIGSTALSANSGLGSTVASVAGTVIAANTIAGTTATSMGAITAGDISINGTSIGAVAAGTTVTEQGANMAAAINGIANTTGVYAINDAGAVSLYRQSSGVITAIVKDSASSANSGLGTSNTTTGSAPTSYKAIIAGDINLNGVAIGAIAAGTSAVTQGDNVATAINLLTSTTGVTASYSTTTGAVSLTSSGAITAIIGRTALTAYSGLGTNLANSAGTMSTAVNNSYALQTASNAALTVDGVSISSASNTATDVIAGVTLDLKAVTTSSATLSLNRDTTAVKANITSFVTAYNDAMSILKEVSDTNSTLDTYGGTMVGDSNIQAIRSQLRGMLNGTSSTPGSDLGALWQIGLSVDKSGVMSADVNKLDGALVRNFDDVVKIFTGNRNGQSVFNTSPAGLAGDSVRKITNLLSTSGSLVTASGNATSRNTKHHQQLLDLQVRMELLLARYTKQFTAMDSIVGSIKSQQTSLKATFEGMMSIYTNK